MWLKREHGYFAGSTPGGGGGGVMHAPVDSGGGALNDIKLSATSAETVDKANESDIIKAKEYDIRNNVIPNMKTDTLVPRQDIHRQGTDMYKQRQAKLRAKGKYGPPYLTISDEKVLELVDKYKSTGEIKFDKNGEWTRRETILNNEEIIGVVVNDITGVSVPTTVFKIHYADNGVHIVPDYPSKKR